MSRAGLFFFEIEPADTLQRYKHSTKTTKSKPRFLQNVQPKFRIRIENRRSQKSCKDDTLLTAYKRSAVCGIEATYLQNRAAMTLDVTIMCHRCAIIVDTQRITADSALLHRRLIKRRPCRTLTPSIFKFGFKRLPQTPLLSSFHNATSCIKSVSILSDRRVRQSLPVSR